MYDERAELRRRDLENPSGRANLAGVRGVARRWRWAVVVAGAALLAAIPAVVGALPVRATAVEPLELATAIAGSATAPYQGYVETRGQLGIPDLPEVDTATSLLGGPAKIRVWRADPASWRVDLLSTTGETDTYGDATGTWTWDSADRRVWRTEQAPGAVRLPRPVDVVPAELGRRILAGAQPDELRPLAAARVAGRSVPGVRVVPSNPASTVDHVDVWADPDVRRRAPGHRRARTAPTGRCSSRSSSTSPWRRPTGASSRSAALGRPEPPQPHTDLLQQLPVGHRGDPAARHAGRAPQRHRARRAGVATYGDGFDVVAVVAVPSFLLDEAIPSTFVQTDRPWGGQARVVETPLVNAMALSSGGLGYVLAGAVTVQELDRVAAVVNADEAGPVTAVIRTEGLTKRYGRLTVVDGVDLDVPAGEVFGFLGPERLRQDHHDPDAARPRRPDGRTSRAARAPDAERPPRRRSAEVGALVEGPGFYPNHVGPPEPGPVRRGRSGRPAQPPAASASATCSNGSVSATSTAAR